MTKMLIPLFILCLGVALPVYGGASPMVERHLFSPEPLNLMKGTSKDSEKSPLVKKLEGELLFTGVIITSSEKRAMIREKRNARNRDVAGLLGVGEEINGMVIKDIGANFVILADKENQLRLNLYHEGKNRPAPPPEPKMPPITTPKADAPREPGTGAKPESEKELKPVAESGNTPKGSAQGSDNTPKASAQNSDKTPVSPLQKSSLPGAQTPSNPFTDALMQAADLSKKRGNANQPASNPFLEAIRRARGE